MHLLDPHHSGEQAHAALPHLEGTPDTRSWWVRKLRHVLQLLDTANGKTFLLGLAFCLVISIVLSVGHLGLIKTIDEHDISKQEVYTDTDLQVVDETATELKRNSAKEKVLPLYRAQAPINLTVRRELDQLFQNLSLLAEDRTRSRSEKYDEFVVLVGDLPETRSAFHHLFEVNHSPSFWAKLKLHTAFALNKLLKKGISTSQYAEGLAPLIQETLSPLRLGGSERETITLLLRAVIQPNQVIDEIGWEEAKNAAADQVIPEVKFFKRGQKILSVGERVTPIKLKALEAMGRAPNGVNWFGFLGNLMLSLIGMGVLWGYLYYYESKQYYKPVYTLLIGSLSTAMVLVFKLAEQNYWPIYILPFASYPLILSVFTHPRVGVLSTALICLLVGLSLSSDFIHLSILLAGSLAGVYVLSRRINFQDRAQLMLAGVYVGLTNLYMMVTLFLLNTPESQLFQIDTWSSLLKALFWSVFASGLGSGILTFGLLPYFESLFGLVTPFMLIELGNHDKPLLKRMQFEAPGTFHHSLMIASLAEAAAEAIGANALLTRVGCLYHDIGKMKRPLYFIENQAYYGVENPHNKMSPRLSKMVITAHPRDSLEMARHHHLPEAIQAFMTEHHGTLLAGYFYNQACQQEGAENVNKSQFRYPGPKPRSKETAIVMLADACESAVRALKSPTLTQIEERIDKIIHQRVEDGQFDECPITFHDIHRIKETFLRVLRGILHHRIEYQQTMIRDLEKKLPFHQVQKS